jgi:hypothetical protein
MLTCTISSEFDLQDVPLQTISCFRFMLKELVSFERLTSQLFYDTLRKLDFEYGPSLTVIRNSWRSDTDYIAELTVPNEIVDDMHSLHLHPCILDGVLQTLSISWISTINCLGRHALLMILTVYHTRTFCPLVPF